MREAGILRSGGEGKKSQFGTLCHELAHIYLGHLGTDREHWWPSRTDLDVRAVEIEAESSAFSDNPSRLGWVKRTVCVPVPGRTTIAVIGFTRSSGEGGQQDRADE
jgi:hypothetical protein